MISTVARKEDMDVGISEESSDEYRLEKGMDGRRGKLLEWVLQESVAKDFAVRSKGRGVRGGSNKEDHAFFEVWLSKMEGSSDAEMPVFKHALRGIWSGTTHIEFCLAPSHC